MPDMNNSQIQSIDDLFKLCRRSFIAIGVFSFFINFLMLTPMFYMINVFDKAVGTGSIPTLVALAVLAALLYATLAALEAIRSRVLIHIASRMDVVAAPRVYELCFLSSAGSIDSKGMGAQPLADLNALRQFIGSQNCAVIFDVPWIPLFVLLMFFFHPALAVVALICMAVMAAIALANQQATTAGLKEANKRAANIAGATQRNLRNAEVASAMGMIPQLTRRWRELQNEMLEVQSKSSVTASGYSALIKTLGSVVQSVAITTGAVLAINQAITPGVMIGAALLLGKSIQPIQQAVSGWRSFVEAREQYGRLNELLSNFPESSKKMALPPIAGAITASGACVIPPGGEKPTILDIDLSLPAGTATMILGPSAAGKSTLIRAILGLWPTMQGEIRIDGAEASRYEQQHLGPQVGYLPQDIELFDGSVAENIARFGEVDSEQVVTAATEAGIHEMILGFPEGYDTVLNASKGLLSPGQRQRIALARALYGSPKLLVLDEPNSNLDEDGEQALTAAIVKAKSLGSSIVMVSHRQGALPVVDHLIVMRAGRIVQQGHKDAVIAQFRAAAQEKASVSQVKAVGAPEA